MAARAIWKGTIEFGAIEVPVKLYSAVEERTVHFRLLHARDLAPVKQKLVNARTGKEVDPRKIQRGAVVAPGRLVILRPDELKRADPKPTRAIEVRRFVPRGSLDHALFDRPFWLGPGDGRGGGYWALVKALQEQKHDGIAHWVMRNRSYAALLRVKDNRLMLVTLHQPGEVVDPAEVELPTGRGASSKELAMARQLVSMLEGRFDPADYRNEYRARVLEFIERKAKGQQVRLEPVRKKRPVADLSQALKRSLAAVSASPRRSPRRKERAHA